MYGKRKFPGAPFRGPPAPFRPGPAQPFRGRAQQRGGGPALLYPTPFGHAPHGPPGPYAPAWQHQKKQQQPVQQQKPKRFFKSDKQVAEALEIFKALFEEAEKKAAAAKAEESKKEEEAKPEEEAKEEEAKEANGDATEEAKDEKKEEAKPVTISALDLSNGYKAKTSNMFKNVFKRPLAEFMRQFTDLFVAVKPNLYRMLSAEEIAANEARAKEVEEERAAKRQKRAEERAKQLAETQKKEAERLALERKTLLKNSVNVLVASDSRLEIESVRRALTKVLTSARYRPFSRVVVVGSGDSSAEAQQGSDAILSSATNRLKDALKRKVLIPAAPKGRGLYCSESAYKAILPEELEQVLQKEKEEAAAERQKLKELAAERKAKVEAARKAKEEAALAKKKEKEAAEAAKKAEEGGEAAEEAKEEPKEEPKEEAKEEPKEEAMKDEEEPEPEAEPRDMVVGDFYVAVETGLVQVGASKLGELPVKEVEQPPANGSVEKKEEAKDEEMTALQKANAEVAAIKATPLDLMDITEADKLVGGPVWLNQAWVVIYDASTGCVARVPTAAVTFAEDLVKKAEADKVPVAKAVADELAAKLETTVAADDPHRVLSAGMLSRGHMLEHALTIGFGQLAQKEMGRVRVANLKKNKLLYAAQKVVTEARQKEREEAAAKRKEELEKKKKEEEEAAAKKAAEEEEAAKKAAEAKEGETEAKEGEAAEPAAMETAEE